MEAAVTDRDVGTLTINPINAPLPHHLSPAAPSSRPFVRNASESSVVSSTNAPSVPRSSSFTGSKRFLTGRGLSARESLGIIDDLQRDPNVSHSTHCDYNAARNIIMGTMTHSPKETPPPPQPATPVSFVGERPPTPPPMPDFSTPTHHNIAKRVRIDPKPPVELPPPPAFDTPSSSDVSTHHPSLPPENHLDIRRAPLRTLSPLRNRLSLSPSGSSHPAKLPAGEHKPRQPLFAFFARQSHRDRPSAHPATIDPSSSNHKQNAAPLNIADLSNPPLANKPPKKTDENNKPVFDANDTSSDDSATHQVPRTPSRPLIIDQTNPPHGKPQRSQPPPGRDKKFSAVPADDESMETTESEKYKDCESPDIQPRRRVEIFRRFRFVQDGRHRPEQLSDFIQTDLPEQRRDHPRPTPAPVVSAAPTMHVAPIDPVSPHDDTMSFTSAHEDGERSSDERPPPAMRDIRKHPRMRVRSPKPLELEPKILEEEKGHLPHVESITTSSSSNSKDNVESPPGEKNVPEGAHDTSVPFTQAEMPHLRLGKGTVTAHAFLSGPSPSKMTRVAHLRRDSHTAFLNRQEEPKLEEIKYGGHTGERETAPLGAPVIPDPGATDGSELKRTMSGLQRKLKEAGAELVNKAKKIPRGSSFSKLRSTSLKDMRSNSAKHVRSSENDASQKKVKATERSQSLPRDAAQDVPKSSNANVPTRAKSPAAQKSPAAPKQEQGLVRTTRPTSTPKVPEFVTIKRVIRRVRRDGTEELVTKRVRVRPEQVLPNGDVVIKRTMKRNKDDGAGTETLTVLQVIPRRKNVKPAPVNSNIGETVKGENDIASLPTLSARREDKETEKLGAKTPQNLYDEGPLKTGEGSGSSIKRRSSSSRSKTDMVDEGGRWRRARSFGRARGETVSRQKTEHRIGVVDGVKGLLPRSKSNSRVGDRETAGLGGNEEHKGWLKKKSLPRVMSFHGRNGKRKESGASSKSEGSWWPFRR